MTGRDRCKGSICFHGQAAALLHEYRIGKVHLSLLFYPPTAALKSGYTLGNATGRELQKENVDMSVIDWMFSIRTYRKIKELRPNKVQKFIWEQLWVRQQSNVTSWRISGLSSKRSNWEIPVLTPWKHPVYLGGVVASLVFKHCYATTEQEPDADVTIPLLRTPYLAECGDIFYAM